MPLSGVQLGIFEGIGSIDEKGYTKTPKRRTKTAKQPLDTFLQIHKRRK